MLKEPRLIVLPNPRVSFYYADRVIGVHHPNLARNKLLNIVQSAVPSSRHRFQGLKPDDDAAGT
jgi:hypothetical protein